MSNEPHSIDGVLSQVINEQITGHKAPVAPPVVQGIDNDQASVQPAQDTDSGSTHSASSDNQSDYLDNVQVDEPAQNTKPDTTETKASDSPIDEYGNPVEKPKTYTEEEVNRMMRERFSRSKYQEPNQQPQSYQPPQPEQQTQQDGENWEVELNKVIDKRLEQKQRDESERRWQEQERVRQAEFETKFRTGMNKYQDFEQVVAGKPITDAMMIAARELDNPAAFVYAASKLHSQELERISRLDSYSQATAIGRLHEKMVKERKALSHTAKPLEPVKGDMPTKTNTFPNNMPSLEERISQHAKRKYGR